MSFRTNGVSHTDATAHKRSWGSLVAVCISAALSGGCYTFFNGQTEVPGTKQRLIVGSNNWPVKKVWVLENGNLETVKIVEAGK